MGTIRDLLISLILIVEVLRDRRETLVSLRPMWMTTIIRVGFSNRDEGGFGLPDLSSPSLDTSVATGYFLRSTRS